MDDLGQSAHSYGSEGCSYCCATCDRLRLACARQLGDRVKAEVSHRVTRQLFQCGPGRGPAARIIPGRREPSERRAMLSVQLARTAHGSVLMVRRRSTVRFRNGAPAQRAISNAGFQDQETRFQDQETSRCDAALAGGQHSATYQGTSGILACGYDRNRSLPVSVARIIGHIIPDGRAPRPLGSDQGSQLPRAPHRPWPSPVERATGRELCSLARVDISEVPEN
jgi:hypothetical protein